MGAEAKCTVRFQDRISSGRALLETDELIFRGGVHLAIPYRDIRRVESSDGVLEVTFSGGVARFDLGAKAAVWAEKIRHPKSVLDKLGVKAGMGVVVLDLPDPEFRAALAARAARVTSHLSAGAALVFLGISDRRGLARLRAVTRMLRPDGAVWAVAPRGSAVVREPDVLAAGKAAGLVDIKVVRFSETHTAHKFVIPVSHRPRRT